MWILFHGRSKDDWLSRKSTTPIQPKERVSIYIAINVSPLRWIQQPITCLYFWNSVTRCRSQSFQNPVFDTPHSQMKVAVKMEHFCIGNRKFERFVECNVHTGRKWSHACLLSVFTGGFGGDRFYLKYWRSGLGKLLTFGGLGKLLEHWTSSNQSV